MLKTQPTIRNIWPHIQSNFDSILQPKDYQKRVLDFMRNNPGLIVFHEMGTGKTVTGLLCAIDFLLQNIDHSVYIVASKTLMDNWNKEIKQFIPSDSPLIFRITVGTMYDFKNRFKTCTFQAYQDRTLMVIVDEAHNYKSSYLERKPIKAKIKPLAIITKATMKTVKTIKTTMTMTRKMNSPIIMTENRKHRIIKKESFFILKTVVNIAKKIIFLTGTPFRNTINDMKNMLQMIMILADYINNPKQTKTKTKIKKYDLSVPHTINVATFMTSPLPDLPNDAELEAGNKTAKTKIINLKNMIDYEGRSGDFPDYKIFYEFLTPSSEFKKLFLETTKKTKQRKNEVAYSRSRIASIHIDPSKIMTTIATNKKTTSSTKSLLSTKIHYILGTVSAEQQELIYDDYIKKSTMRSSNIPDLRTTKTVIYSGLNIKFLEKELPKLIRANPEYADIKIFFITGNSSKKERQKAREDFNALENNAILMISQAANEGVDLKGVGHVFFIDGVWNPAEFEQIMGRAIRHGSHADFPNRTVEIHILFDKGSEFPQEAMDSAVKNKYKIMKSFKDMIKNFNVALDNNTSVVQAIPLSTLQIIPLELIPDKFTQFGLTFDTEQDNHLDIFQILSIQYMDTIFGAIPDNVNKIFSKIYNDEKYNAVESYFKEIRRLQNDDLFILYLDLNDDIMYDIITEYSGKKIWKKMTNIQSLPKDRISILLCSYNEGSFGHYAVFLYNPSSYADKLFYYDSMLRSQKDDEDYIKIFTRLLGRYFKLPANIEIDFPDGPYDVDHIYSMECTGGNPEKYNPYIDLMKKVSGEEKTKLLQLQVLGVDNQNQFCYIWCIIYIICKIMFWKGFSTIDWKVFLTNICKHQIIPLVVVKIFILLSRPIMSSAIREKWTTIPFLSRYFSLITSNADTYNETFKSHEYALFNINIPAIYVTNINQIWRIMTNEKSWEKIKLKHFIIDKIDNDLRDKIIRFFKASKEYKSAIFDHKKPMSYKAIVDELNQIELKYV